MVIGTQSPNGARRAHIVAKPRPVRNRARITIADLPARCDEAFSILAQAGSHAVHYGS
jgi:hypothetical protein